MVENSNLLPPASEGEMSDHGMVDHGAPFDRQCSVSQRVRAMTDLYCARIMIDLFCVRIMLDLSSARMIDLLTVRIMIDLLSVRMIDLLSVKIMIDLFSVRIMTDLFSD